MHWILNPHSVSDDRNTRVHYRIRLKNPRLPQEKLFCRMAKAHRVVESKTCSLLSVSWHYYYLAGDKAKCILPTLSRSNVLFYCLLELVIVRAGSGDSTF